MSPLKLESPAFSEGEDIPRKYGYTKKNINPPLKISGVPEGTTSLVLIMDDPDAVKPAGKIWDHWVVWNIDPLTTDIGKGEVPPGGAEGKNDFGEQKYGGPNPPNRKHTYRFKLYALDTTLDLRSSATKKDVKQAMKGHIIDKAKLTGSYAP